MPALHGTKDCRALSIAPGDLTLSPVMAAPLIDPSRVAGAGVEEAAEGVEEGAPLPSQTTCHPTSCSALLWHQLQGQPEHELPSMKGNLEQH